MESTAIYRKPKKWIAVTLGLLIPPAGMLYVARPRWAAAYFALELIIALGSMFALRDRELAGNAIALLVAIICAIHAYRVAGDSRVLRRPWYSRWYGLVGLIAAFAALAFGTRAFLFEPFRFPSGSMTPSIEPRAHLIVKKWGYGNYGTYGIHLMRSSMSSEVQRGDVVVFEYPEDTALSYAKRVVGLPGDRISYYSKRLWVNDQEVPLRPIGDYAHHFLSGNVVFTPRKACLAGYPMATTLSWVTTATTAATAEPGDSSPQETSLARFNTYSNSE